MTDLFATPCHTCATDAQVGYLCDQCGQPVCVDCVCSDAGRGVPSGLLAGSPTGFLCPSCPGAFVRYLPTGESV